MWEVIAISTETNRVWRWRVQGGQQIRLGRCPKSGWATPWDLRISSEHADLHFYDDYLRVVRLPTARNAIHFRGVPTNDFCVRAGEEFRIGLTSFRVYLVPALEPVNSRGGSGECRNTIDTSSPLSGASLQDDLEFVLNLIDHERGTEHSERSAVETHTPDGQESTTRTPAVFAKLLEREDAASRVQALGGGSNPEAARQAEEQRRAREAELEALRAKLSSMEGALQNELKARQEAEDRAARVAEEANQRLAEEARRREAEAKKRADLESQLAEARLQATRQQEELEDHLAALEEAERFRNESQDLKSELDRLQQQLVERTELHQSAQSQIRDLMSAQEQLKSTESNRRQQDAEKMRHAEEAIAAHAAQAESLREEMESLQARLARKMEEQRQAETAAQRYAEEEQRWRLREEQLQQEIEDARRQAEEEVERHRIDADTVKAELALLRAQLEKSAADQQSAEAIVRQLMGEERQRAVEAEQRREAETAQRSAMEAEAQRRREEAEALGEQVAALTARIQEQSEQRRQAERMVGQLEQQHSIESTTLRDELRKLQEQAEAKSEVAAMAREALDQFVATEQANLTKERAERLAAQKAREEAEREAGRRRAELDSVQQQFADLQAHLQRGSEAQRRAEEEAERWRREAETLKEGLKALEARVAEPKPAALRPVPRRRTASDGEFDPYYRWLAIPPEEQPPDNYRLLGLARFEDNLEIIESAADRQMDFVRRQHSGKHGALSQRLLNEISRARICLRDPEKKRQYDEELWAELESAQAPLVVSSQSAAMVSQSLDGSAFRDYSLLDYIAETRHGHVFKASHRTLGRLVAMTVQSDAAASEPQLALRFRLKALLLARAQHPYLLRAFDAGHQEKLQYLVTDFVEGQHLVALLKQYGALPVEKAVRYAVQTAEALHYLHENGIVHRNVKPSNILLAGDGTIRILGLGSAFYKRNSPLVDTNLVDELEEPWPSGSPDYMAPEQAENSAMVGRRADIYSLGCTLFTLLTRRLVFPLQNNEAKQRAHREQRPPSLALFRKDVSPELDAVYQRMVSKVPRERYDTFASVLDAIRDCGFQW